MAGGRAVLYHGTRYPTSILRTGVLFAPGFGKISFTRSPEVAAYWALMERCPDEGRGAILIFDRTALGCRYALTPVHEQWVEVGGRYWHDEAEEEVWTDIVNIGRYLIGHVFTEDDDRSSTVKRLNRSTVPPTTPAHEGATHRHRDACDRRRQGWTVKPFDR
jgi:hypothetical protein